jgi:Arc/MetJ-type ribon-helix-helix transcriptional regulator
MEAIHMSNELSPDTESFIAGEVALGTFGSRTDAIEAGIELLKKRRQLLDRIAESARQLEEGEYVEFDEDGLRLFFEGLKERACRRAEAS